MTSLREQCYFDGFIRGLAKQLQPLEKSATAATIARIAIPPGRRGEMIALGERLFRESGQNQNVWSGLRAALNPGHGQLDSIRALRRNFAELLRRAPAPDRARLQQDMHRQLQDALAEVGALAHPRIQFQEKTLPMIAAGAGGAGIGLAGGAALGTSREQDRMKHQLEDAPIWERLKYLFAPGSMPVNPDQPKRYFSSTRPGGISPFPPNIPYFA